MNAHVCTTGAYMCVYINVNSYICVPFVHAGA